MIKTEKLAKIFGNNIVVEDLSLEVQEGQIFGFLGPNGAGKTTTIRMLSGLIAPSSGKAWVAGYRLGAENEKVRASCGILTESPGLYEQLTALDNLLFYAELYELPPLEARKRVQEILEWMDLWSRRNEPVATFSKGMKQKLAIGRALLHRPRVLFLDEPTAGLDAESARAVRDSIVALKNIRRTIFLSTHNMEEAEKLCDQIAIFKIRLVQLDTPINLKRRFGVGNRVVRIRLRRPVSKELLIQLQSQPYVQKINSNEGDETGFTLEIGLADPENQNPTLIRLLIEGGAEIQFIEEQTPSLEEVFLSLTSK
jgi:ABC-2 type transport system ATP-binding protein